MLTTEEARERLAAIPNLTISRDEPLWRHTRFAIGGPADLYAETSHEETFLAALHTARASGIETVIIGGRIVMRNRKLLTVNEEQVLAKARAYRKTIAASLGLPQ